MNNTIKMNGMLWVVGGQASIAMLALSSFLAAPSLWARFTNCTVSTNTDRRVAEYTMVR